MKTPIIISGIWLLVMGALSTSLMAAEKHRATHLGNPATRFAAPISNPEDLRARFRDDRLQQDMVEVLRQWKWPGKTEDLFQAASTAKIWEAMISVGTTMPFMSSRENGKPICLRNVTWAGEKPAPAFAFSFVSNGRKYRCVTPKACSNFYIEDIGLEPIPALSVDCEAPSEVLPGRPAQAFFIVRNLGTGEVKNGILHLTVPETARVLNVTEGGIISSGAVTWNFTNLAPKGELTFAASISAPSPGSITFITSVSGANVPEEKTSHCETKVVGIPAILIDAIDLEDPVEVGQEVTYEIKVTNQGSAEATNVKLLFILPPNQDFVSGSGDSPIHSEAAISADPLPSLSARGVAVWRVVVKATQPGDIRFKVQLSSDQFTRPIHEEESTLIY